VAVTPLARTVAIDIPAGSMAALGDAVHAFLAADLLGDAAERRAIPSRLLVAHRVSSAVAPDALLRCSRRLRSTSAHVSRVGNTQ
jgi:hypothetical protein